MEQRIVIQFYAKEKEKTSEICGVYLSNKAENVVMKQSHYKRPKTKERNDRFSNQDIIIIFNISVDSANR